MRSGFIGKQYSEPPNTITLAHPRKQQLRFWFNERPWNTSKPHNLKLLQIDVASGSNPVVEVVPREHLMFIRYSGFRGHLEVCLIYKITLKSLHGVCCAAIVFVLQMHAAKVLWNAVPAGAWSYCISAETVQCQPFLCSSVEKHLAASLTGLKAGSERLGYVLFFREPLRSQGY